MFDDLKNALSGVSAPVAHQFTQISNIIAAVANILVAAGISVSFIGLAYAFVQFIMSQGDKMGIDQAKRAATWSTVALLISILVAVIKGVVFQAFGFSVFPNEF